MCWVSYIAASAKYAVTANCPPLKQNDNSQDLSIEKKA